MLITAGAVAVWRQVRQPQFYEAGTFVLEPRNGHPMVCSSGWRIHFRWDGEALAVTRGDVPAGVHETEFTRYRELTSTVQLADREIEVDGDVIATALSPTVPDGWRRCMAVTVGKGRQERIDYIGGGEEARTKVEYRWDEYSAQFYDFGTAELEAEIELNEMYAVRRELMLNTVGYDTGDLDLAVVMSSVLGLADELGVTGQFQTGRNSMTYETGILDREMWEVLPSGLSGYGVPQEVPDIFMGTGGRFAVVYRMTRGEELLAFYESSSSASSMQSSLVPAVTYHLSTRYLAKPCLAVLAQLLEAELTACMLSAIMMAILAGIWHFLLPRRSR